MVLINGRSEHCIDVADRGVQYGDGLFETMAICNGEPLHVQEHLDRLERGCIRLLIPCPPRAILISEAKQLVHTVARGVLKLIVTRGTGGRGYRQPDNIQATRIFSLHPYPDYPDYLKQQGIVTRFCHTRLGLNPILAGIKHLNRLEQILARAEWNDSNIHEGLMLDSLGRVIEGTMSNLFFIKNNALITAPVTDSGVAGIQRQCIIRLAAEHDIPVQEQYFQQSALLEADEVFVTNSIIGIWPVRQIEQNLFPVGTYTQQFLAWQEACT